MKTFRQLALAAISALLLLGTTQTSTAQDVDLSKYPDSDHATTVLGFRAGNSCHVRCEQTP